jgi:hypothetical protein
MIPLLGGGRGGFSSILKIQIKFIRALLPYKQNSILLTTKLPQQNSFKTKNPAV